MNLEAHNARALWLTSRYLFSAALVWGQARHVSVAKRSNFCQPVLVTEVGGREKYTCHRLFSRVPFVTVGWCMLFKVRFVLLTLFHFLFSPQLPILLLTSDFPVRVQLSKIFISCNNFGSLISITNPFFHIIPTGFDSLTES